MFQYQKILPEKQLTKSRKDMYNNSFHSHGLAGSHNTEATQAEESARGLLQMLNKDELQQLNDDGAKVTDLINDLPQVKALAVEKDTLMMSNRSAAEYNLSRQPRLEQARSLLAKFYEQAIEQQKLYENTKIRLSGASSAESLDTVLALLQTESAKAEEDSEEITERFLGGEMDIEQFLLDYTQKRTLGHLRKVKVEKLEEIIRSQNRQGPPQAASYSPYGSAANPNNSQSYGKAPYPMYGGMPDHSVYLPR